MGKFERMMADFAKELLVTVFVVTIFVQAGGTAFGQESVELFISGYLLCQELVGGCPLFKE
jgi:hypothetical protein